MDLLTLATACTLGTASADGLTWRGCESPVFFAPRVGLANAAPVTAPWDGFIAEASRRFAVPPSWIRTVMRAESGGRTHFEGAPVTSPAGAMGLMQVMPGTYAELRQRHGLGADPYDPHNNILAGTAYMREMIDRFGVPGFLAAYNAGPERMAEHLAGRRPLPAETRRYLTRLAPLIEAKPQPVSAPATLPARHGGRLFFSLKMPPDRPRSGP